MSLIEKHKTILANLNYLLDMITFINNSLDMNIDEKLFRTKIIADIFFVTNTIIKVETYLRTETIKENDLIPIIKRLKWTQENTILLLDNIVNGNYKHFSMFATSIKDFKKISKAYKLSTEKIQQELKKRLFAYQTNDTQVSREEFQHLFLHEENAE